jgi:hypothetical protein
VAGLNIPPGRKLALLDMVQPEAINCVLRLTKNLVLSPTTTKSLSLSIAMLKYLAEGYKSVLVNALKIPATPPNLIVSSSHSVIEVLSQILLECWECYIPPPANTWKEIHAVYQLVRLRNLESIAPGSSRTNTGVAATIRAAYVRPLLMACADPSRYAPQELRQIAAFLSTAGNLVEFAQNHLDGIFVVNAMGDKGPQYSFKVEGTTKRHFHLRTGKLVKHIEDRLSSGTLTGLPSRLARDLCRYWSEEVKRQDHPVTENTEITLIFGLGNIHRELSGTQNLDEYLQQLASKHRHGKPSLELAQDSTSSHRDIFIGQTKKPGQFDIKDKPILYEESQKSKTLRKYIGRRTNHSESGARLEVDAPSEMLTAGELVAFQLGAGHQWSLGLVRWVRITPKLTRVMGVQLFRGTVGTCVISQITSASDGSEQHYPGLELSRDDNTVLIVSSLPFREYASVSFQNLAGKRTVKLMNKTTETYHIACFNLDKPV